jgi:hypothetical protein
MFIFKPIVLEQLKEIQEGVLKLIPRRYLMHERLFYPQIDKEIFLRIDPLREALKKFNWLDKINRAGFAINVVNPQSETAIHIDSGTFPYSFNIPITHCSDSILNFYRLKENFTDTDNALSSSALRTTPSGTTYHRFEKSICEVIDSYNSSVPFLMNTKIIHSITNMSDNKRVTLLVRLSNDILI